MGKLYYICNTQNEKIMESLKNLKVGHLISIKGHDEMIKRFLKENVFKDIDINHLKYICRLKTEKHYKVVDVCKTCKICKIKVGKMWVPIKYEFIAGHKDS